jgi:eukaryotic-like serine/threonine-protein kinase
MTSEPAPPRQHAASLRRRLLLPALAGVILASLAVAVPLAMPRKQPAEKPAPTVVWTFEQPESGAFISTPVVDKEHIYAAGIRDNALAPSGIVYCLDRRRGTVCWKFDDDGTMRHTISSPCLAGSRLYVGEGMHGNDVCKMYCLDAASGRKQWHFVTGGHIESSACVADGAVFFGSGDDGLYCLDAVSGKKRWQFSGRWHIDARPAVVAGRVFVGSGVSRLHRTTEFFCLDAATSRLLWRIPTELPVWGSPTLDKGQVFFGTGTGRLTQSAEPPEKPAGVLYCIDAATGQLCWSARLDEAIFGRPAVDAEHVYFGARDGRCYCLNRRDGQRIWQADLGSPIVTTPALSAGRLIVVASGGQVACLDAGSGQTMWTFDVASHTQTRPQLLSSPIVVPDDGEEVRHPWIYFGTELRTSLRSTAVLYCLRE